jgi:hypothetical protein
MRDDLIQRRGIETLLKYWSAGSGNNPVSSVYGGRMIGTVAVWTWDARPYPVWPARTDAWGDAFGSYKFQQEQPERCVLMKANATFPTRTAPTSPASLPGGGNSQAPALPTGGHAGNLRSRSRPSMDVSWRTVMRAAWLTSGLLATCLSAGAASADQPYLFDLLKQKAYHAAWDAMFKGEKKVDAWIVTFGKTYDGVTDQTKPLVVDSQADTLGWLCKPHDCGGNQLYVLFGPGALAAWGMLVTDKGPRWFGRPSDSIKAALTKASNQQ